MKALHISMKNYCAKAVNVTQLQDTVKRKVWRQVEEFDKNYTDPAN